MYVDPRGLSLEALERYCRMFASWAARNYWAYVPAEHAAFVRELQKRCAAS